MRLARRRRARGSDSGSSTGCKGSKVIRSIEGDRRWGPRAHRPFVGEGGLPTAAAHYSIAGCLRPPGRIAPPPLAGYARYHGCAGSPPDEVEVPARPPVRQVVLLTRVLN